MELEERPMLENEDFDSESELLPRPTAQRAPSQRTWGLTLALLGATGALALVSNLTGREPTPAMLHRLPSNAKFSVLDEADEDPCHAMPSMRILGIKTNNLGYQGPDKDAPEGLVYQAESHHTGLDGDVEIHLHAVSESYFAESHEADGDLTNFTAEANYHAEWPTENGITGHFGTINIHPGTNVTCVLRGYDPAAKKHIHLPKWSMSFFDLDTGKGGNSSIEFLRIKGFHDYFLSNSSELEVSQELDGSTRFTGTQEGTGDDNPENPLELTVLQKNRAVSFVFEDTAEIVFEIGASPGATARVFQFVVRPILRCAFTKLNDTFLLPANDPNSPIVPKRGGSSSRSMLTIGLGVAALLPWL